MNISLKKWLYPQYLGMKSFQQDKRNGEEGGIRKRMNGAKKLKMTKKKCDEKESKKKRAGDVIWREKGEKQRRRENNCGRDFILSRFNNAR